MIKKKLVVANGEYQTRDGQTKTRWVTVGALHEHEGRHYVTLDRHINLAGLEHKEGDNRVFANLFDPDQDRQGPASSPSFRAQAPTPAKPDFDDDVPF